MRMHVKRTRSHQNGERAHVERRCSGKIAAIDDQIEPGRLVLLVRWGSASAVALRKRTAGGASDQLAWGGRARGTVVAGILQMRDLCLVSASLISFFSRIVHQVAVICRFALLGTQKKRGSGSGENKSRPFGRAFLNCSRARNHGDAARRTRPLRDEKQEAELMPKWRIREFGGLRVGHFD